jgi:hypothetical protein
MPLHRPKTLSMYHQQLAYCVMQYIEKDVAMSAIVVEGLVKSWPWTSSSKQVVFLNELEEVLELMGAEQVEQVLEPLFRTIAKCVGSRHFQVRTGCGLHTRVRRCARVHAGRSFDGLDCTDGPVNCPCVCVQVAERALFLWNNDHLLNVRLRCEGCHPLLSTWM